MNPAPDCECTVAQARAAVAARLRPLDEPQTLPLSQALGRVLARDLISPIAVPAHDNSAMDGYALTGSDLLPDDVTRLQVLGTVLAGRPWRGPPLVAGQCLRIMTGAVMPAGLDTVVPHEQCHLEGQMLRIAAGAVRPGEHRRRRGEDLASGEAALRAGRLLKPADLGLIASLGVAQVSVQRRLRVALFSTGDELRALGQPLEPGCIYDSNRYSLMGALQRLGLEVIDLGLVRDDPQALQATLQDAMARADVILTSGGVSAGDADHVRAVLDAMGHVEFWQLALRPGRPLAFGSLHRADGGPPAWLFALPGNPVAALVAFYVLVRDALLQLAGATPQPLPTLQARCQAPIRKRPGRSEYPRGIVEPDPAGGWQVRLTGPQGSGVLSSMSLANALLVLPPEQGPVAAGALVEVLLFDGLV